MKTIALLGGMTYGATSIYYNIINRQIQRKLGGTHSANLLLQSFDHAEMGAYFTRGEWAMVTSRFSKAASNLKAAGADGVMICCNIGHKVADEVEKQGGLPLLHIADPTGQKIKDQGIKKVALIGTKPVMEDSFVS
jgi:aspartate racemase